MSEKTMCYVCSKEVKYSYKVQIILTDSGAYKYILPYETKFQKLANAHRDCAFKLDRLPENLLIKNSHERI